MKTLICIFDNSFPVFFFLLFYKILTLGCVKEGNVRFTAWNFSLDKPPKKRGILNSLGESLQEPSTKVEAYIYIYIGRVVELAETRRTIKLLLLLIWIINIFMIIVDFYVLVKIKLILPTFGRLMPSNCIMCRKIII